MYDYLLFIKSYFKFFWRKTSVCIWQHRLSGLFNMFGHNLSMYWPPLMSWHQIGSFPRIWTQSEYVLTFPLCLCPECPWNDPCMIFGVLFPCGMIPVWFSVSCFHVEWSLFDSRCPESPWNDPCLIFGVLFPCGMIACCNDWQSMNAILKRWKLH